MTIRPLAIALVVAGGVAGARQTPTECADNSMTLWMWNSAGKTPCELVQDVLRVCDAKFEIGFLPRSYTCNNGPGSDLAPCCCGSPTFALMSACWSCQYNVTFDLVTTTFTSFEKDCAVLPDPITTYDTSVRSSIAALSIPAWSMVEPLAGKWDMASAWKNATPDATTAPPVPTGYPIQVNSTGISKGALAGAIIGAILGSKILFMIAGYFFWRWWRKQPGHRRDDDDEKGGYGRQIVGESRYHIRSRLHGRSRRGSRGEVDLDEDTTTPRSSRWLVPAYLNPTSFHSDTSRSVSPPPPLALAPDQPGDVTPFHTNDRPLESEKARTRRQSVSLRVTNDPAAHDHDHDHDHAEGGIIPAPLPALLARARTLSGGPSGTTPPQSPSLSSPFLHSGSSPIMLASQGRSNSQSLSTNTGSSSAAGAGARRYQEDDAGVSLVIENGREGSPSSGSGGGIRSVPPAYVDYRQGYSQDKGGPMPRFGSEEGGGGTSESATYVGSGSSNNPTRAGSLMAEKAMSSQREEVGASPSVEHSTLPSTAASAPLSADHGSSPATVAETPPAAAPETVPEAQVEDDVRDRTTSGDSEGAQTIKPDVDVSPPTKPLERSSTTDLATLTATNTVANQSSGPGTPATVVGPSASGARPGTSASGSGGRPGTSGSGGRPGSSGKRSGNGSGSPTAKGPTRQASAPAGVTLPGSDSEQTTASTPAQPAEASWTWSRALGVFGIAFPGTGGPPQVPPKD